MSKQLETIQRLIQETKDKLAQCNPKSLKQADMDKTVQERMQLKEKLSMLSHEEERELAAIAEKNAIERQSRKEELLKNLAENSIKQEKKFNELSKQAEQAMRLVVDLLEQRSELFYPSSLGLRSSDSTELLSEEEVSLLISGAESARYRHHGAGFEASFSKAFRAAFEHLPTDSTVRQGMTKSIESMWHAGKFEPLQQSIPEICDTILNPNDPIYDSALEAEY